MFEALQEIPEGYFKAVYKAFQYSIFYQKQALGREPTVEETCEDLGLSPQQVRDFWAVVEGVFI